MVHYKGIIPAFHKINWNFSSMATAFLAAKYRPLFTMYQLWRSVSHKLIKIETSNFSHTYIYSYVIDPD